MTLRSSRSFQPGSSYSGRMFAETPLIGGGMTPAPAFDEGGRTPAPHSMFDASRTPARDEYGGRTPGDDFGMTPGRDVWTATTPRHVPQEYNPDDEYDVQREEMKKYQASQSSASGAAGLPLNLLVRFDGRKFKINAPLASGKYEVKDVDSGAVQNVDADSLTVVRLRYAFSCSPFVGCRSKYAHLWVAPFLFTLTTALFLTVNWREK